MNRSTAGFILCASVCIPLCARAQTGPGSAAPATTIHTSADLVVVDVVASDAKQNPVHHLTAADFTVLEDGKPQVVNVFEEHATTASGSDAPDAEVPSWRV